MRPSLPSCHRSNQTKPEWGQKGEGWGQGAWENCSESLAALPLPRPTNIALSVTPSFQNTPFGISQLCASVSPCIEGVGADLWASRL